MCISIGIENGDFEDGPTAWTEYSAQSFDLIVQASSLPVPPHGGNWAVWLGGAYDEISFIQQQVDVPASMPYLAYYHWIASGDYCGYDYGGVIVNGTVVDVYDLCDSESTDGWVKHAVNLGAYAGQSVSLQIRVETDDSLNSNLFVVDVAFQASATAAQGVPAYCVECALPKPREGTLSNERKRKNAAPPFMLRPRSRE